MSNTSNTGNTEVKKKTLKEKIKKKAPKIKLWMARISACLSFSMLISTIAISAVGSAGIPLIFIAVPSCIGSICAFLVRHGPSNLDDIREYFMNISKDDPAKQNEINDFITDVQTALTERSEQTNINIEPFQNTPEPTPRIKLSYNPILKRFEYEREN